MPYKVAVASSDEIHIDETFGSASRFLIYEITDDKYKLIEERVFEEGNIDSQCGVSNGCNSGGCNGGAKSGCSGNEGNSQKVELIKDCRCVVCKKIGFQIIKQLERKAITAFDVNCTVQEALDKISFYYNRVDKGNQIKRFAYRSGES